MRLDRDFAAIPNMVWTDARLTKIQLRVLLCLWSFNNPRVDDSPIYPKRSTIADRTGLTVQQVSKATSELVALGWLTKKGNGGRSMSANYSLCLPAMDSKTV